MQQYDVVYQSGGQEFTQRVQADDAASAAAMIQNEHRREEGLFELIAINLIETASGETDPISMDESLTPS